MSTRCRSRWKSGHHGAIRSICVDPSSSWVVVGFSTGLLSLLDVRTGILLYCWRAHESDVTKIRATPGNNFVTGSADHTAALWNWGSGGETVVSPTAR